MQVRLRRVYHPERFVAAFVNLRLTVDSLAFSLPLTYLLHHYLLCQYTILQASNLLLYVVHIYRSLHCCPTRSSRRPRDPTTTSPQQPVAMIMVKKQKRNLRHCVIIAPLLACNDHFRSWLSMGPALKQGLIPRGPTPV